MQRWCSKLGRYFLFSSRSALRPIPPRFLEPVAFPANTPIIRPVSCDPSPGTPRPQVLGLGYFHPSPLLGAMQTRHYAAKERSRAPITPVTSKVKKYKLKAFSSFKFRFRTMNDGKIRRWRAGRRHNAHLKTKKAKRRLRKPEVVHPAYAKVIKKLNFCG